MTWSINSICHVYGDKPFVTRDRSGNVLWLAIPSLGESWHNLHHADPTAARHGVLPGQIDPSAALIRGFEKAGWAYDVRWPTPSGSPLDGPPEWRRRTTHLDLVTKPAGKAAPTPPTTSRGRMSGAERRDQLIDVGRKLFAEKGFDGTSVEEIASKAGRLQAGRLRALRRQGGPLRRRRRPRDAAAARRGDRRR